MIRALAKMAAVWLLVVWFMGAALGAFAATYYGTQVHDILTMVTEKIDAAMFQQ